MAAKYDLLKSSDGQFYFNLKAANGKIILTSERYRFERHLRRCLKEALDAAGIEMPNRQVDVWMRGVVTAA